jgi:hypothetical protein
MRARGTKRHRRRTRGDSPAILIRQGGPRPQPLLCAVKPRCGGGVWECGVDFAGEVALQADTPVKPWPGSDRPGAGPDRYSQTLPLAGVRAVGLRSCCQPSSNNHDAPCGSMNRTRHRTSRRSTGRTENSQADQAVADLVVRLSPCATACHRVLRARRRRGDRPERSADPVPGGWPSSRASPRWRRHRGVGRAVGPRTDRCRRRRPPLTTADPNDAGSARHRGRRAPFRPPHRRAREGRRVGVPAADRGPGRTASGSLRPGAAPERSAQ